MKRRVIRREHREAMFGEAWLVMAAFVTVLGLLFRVESLVFIAVMLLSIVPMAWAWNALIPWGLSYRRIFSERRAFVGETVELTVRVANAKPIPVPWLRVRDLVPAEIPLEGGVVEPSSTPGFETLVQSFSLGWFEAEKRRYRLRCVRRGFYRFGPASMDTGDIFGLFTRWLENEAQDVFIVYPRVVPLEELGLPAKEPFGEERVRLRFLEDPSRTAGVRDYRPEDGFRRIHWKATARHQKLKSRVYEMTTTFTLAVFINVATFPRHWQGVDEALLEDVISVAASIAHYGLRHRYSVGVFANGSWPYSDQPVKVPPGRSPRHVTRVFEALAALTSFATLSIEELLLRESPFIPWGATLVVVTGVLYEELFEALARLRQKGRRLVLISLAEEEPPELEGIIVYRLRRGFASQEG